jgi:hypothetical protein
LETTRKRPMSRWVRGFSNAKGAPPFHGEERQAIQLPALNYPPGDGALPPNSGSPKGTFVLFVLIPIGLQAVFRLAFRSRARAVFGAVRVVRLSYGLAATRRKPAEILGNGW